MTDSSKDAVLKLVGDAGVACLVYQREQLRNLPCKRIQCDEIWSFVYAKAKNVPAEFQGQFSYGDVWTWTAIDADTKLVPCWHVGTLGMRRFTRLTNAFSKKVANHGHAVALFYTYYNFGRIDQILRVTPAMAAGVSDHVWSMEEIAGLIP
jgi:hypothetical protein